MKSFRVPFVVTFGCALATALAWSKDPGKVEPVPAEEYEVYAAALKEMVGGVSYVIIDTSSTHDKPETLDRALSFPIDFESLVTNDLVKDFSDKNKQHYTITQQFPNNVHVTLLSEREEHELFADSSKDGWKTFYEKHGHGSGITRISRVGFNKSHDVATVYVGNVAGWEVGHGAYVLLRKVDGKWTVLAKTRGWIA